MTVEPLPPAHARRGFFMGIKTKRRVDDSFPFCSFPSQGKGDRRRMAAVEEVIERIHTSLSNR